MSDLTRRCVMLAMGAAALARGGPARAETSSFPVSMSDAEWRRKLTKDQYAILRRGGTEVAFTSPLDREKRAGTFTCAGCDAPLFASATKFDSRTGWPSFYAPIDRAVGEEVDGSFRMTRTSVHCARCGGHLGHVFKDGPPPTGLRYCMNGLAMGFRAGAA